MKPQLLFWLLAAPDGHVKNFSIFLEREGRYRLAPLYDIMSAYPVMGYGDRLLSPARVKMAMALRGKSRHYEWAKIRLRHWEGTAHSCRLNLDVKLLIEDIAARVPAALKQVESELPKDFPDSIATPIFSGFKEALGKLLGEIKN